MSDDTAFGDVTDAPCAGCGDPCDDDCEHRMHMSEGDDTADPPAKPGSVAEAIGQMLVEHLEHRHAELLASSWRSGGALPAAPAEDIEKAAQQELDVRGLGHWTAHVGLAWTTRGTLVVWVTREPAAE